MSKKPLLLTAGTMAVLKPTAKPRAEVVAWVRNLKALRSSLHRRRNLARPRIEPQFTLAPLYYIMIIMHKKSWFSQLLGIHVAVLFAGCGSLPPVGAPENRLPTGEVPPNKVRWPEGYRPEETSFFVSNFIDIEAPADVVWRQLMTPELWPTWYEGAENVKVEARLRNCQ
jgi:hypothetical protein